jgi:asparagine synthase (glutamine-hydrolysing)
MGSICGWMGEFRSAASPDAVIAGMAAVSSPRAIAEKRADAFAGLSIAPEAQHGHGDMASDLWVAIEGRPRWMSREIASIAESSGHAEALKAAYRRFDTQFLEHITGAFALALIDRSRGRLVLAIDRIGIHSLCYGALPMGGVAFAATVDALRAHPSLVATVPAQAIFTFLHFGYCPSPETIYQEQRKLLPAQYLLHENGTVRTDFYWRMSYAPIASHSRTELEGELFTCLRNAVRRATTATEPATWGAFLSGGLDSSTVAGLLAELSTGPLKTFTIGFTQDRFDEMAYARIAAQHFGCQHYHYYLKPDDVVDAAVRIAAQYDEPFGNSSVFPAFYCAKLAKEHGVELMLAGDGGDEIFAGNSRYVEQNVFELYGKLPAVLGPHLLEPILFGLPERVGPGLVRKVRNYVRFAKVPLPDRLEARNFYQQTPLGELFLPECLAEIAADAPLQAMREAYFRPRTDSALQRMLHLDLKFTLADNDLRKVSGACALAGLEVAYPFLDEEVVEFSGKVPPRLLIRRFERRYFFKRAMAKFLPPEVLAKKKHGFGMPYADWPREHPAVRELASDCITDFKRRNYLRPAFLDRLAAPSGEADDAHRELVWDIMMLELWFRHRDASHSTRSPVGDHTSVAGR